MLEALEAFHEHQRGLEQSIKALQKMKPAAPSLPSVSLPSFSLPSLPKISAPSVSVTPGSNSLDLGNRSLGDRYARLLAGVLAELPQLDALDLADQVEAIKEIYYRISPGTDQSAFFRHKGWDYERTSPLKK